jgi:hypothetical protein
MLFTSMYRFPAIGERSEHIDSIAKANDGCSRHQVENYLHSFFIGHTRNSEDQAHLTSDRQNGSTDPK